MGRAPRTKETLPEFQEWCRATRHPLLFRGLTSSQRTPRFWGVTPRNPRVPLTTCQCMEYLWVSHISIPPGRIPFIGIHSYIYILEKYTNLSKQIIRVRVTTLLYTKYHMKNLIFFQKGLSKPQSCFLHTYGPR